MCSGSIREHNTKYPSSVVQTFRFSLVLGPLLAIVVSTSDHRLSCLHLFFLKPCPYLPFFLQTLPSRQVTGAANRKQLKKVLKKRDASYSELVQRLERVSDLLWDSSFGVIVVVGGDGVNVA